MKTKVLFMGTPAFAVPTLKMLTEYEGIEVCAVVTQPDRQAGRGYKLTPPPVKEFALENGLEIVQPLSVKDDAFARFLAEKDPDLIVVAAYGKILPSFVLHYPKLGCMNVHASLLPKYRGAAPIHWCLINGEKETGVTTMLMEEGLDTGDMLCKSVYQIQPEDTTGVLFEKLADLGADTMKRTLEALFSGRLTPEKQDERLSSYAPMIKKEFCYMDWTKSSEELCSLIKGLSPFPGAKTTINGKILKILSAVPGPACALAPGTVAEGKGRLLISCGDGQSLWITRLQMEGKKPMDSADYLKGHSFEEGSQVGK